jgi:3-dehydroquinate synthetase
MAEVVKTAIIGSPGLFEFIERELDGSPSRKLREIGFLERCVTECVGVKAGIVERDPLERDERRVLNLGHTLGHALEAAGRYSDLAHGEAVSIGLIAAIRVALGRGLVSEGLLERTMWVLDRCGLPVSTTQFDESLVKEALQLDKKRRSGRLHFVLPIRLGATEIVNDVTEAELISAVWSGAK